jgi:hypothetical protein
LEVGPLRRDPDLDLHLRRLRAALAHGASAGGRGAVVLVHHPLSDMCLEGNRWFAKTPNICLVVERRAVRAVLEESGKVAAVLSGHAHWNHLALERLGLQPEAPC